MAIRFNKWSASFMALLISAFGGGAVISIGYVISAHAMEAFGFSLFFTLPLLAGSVSTVLYSHGREFTMRGVLGVSGLTAVMASLLFLLGGLEGIVCIIMALPILLPMTMLGGLLGGALVLWIRSRRTRRVACIALLALWSMGLVAEPHLLPGPPMRTVKTSVLIQADQQRVWDTVIAFPKITAEPKGILRSGIAYPISAELDGQGVGAIRRCSFNTGDFVEPITVWDEPHLLAFDVTENPLPMQEWSFYGPIDTPHLHGIFVSHRGQFRLKSAGPGWVELEGTTWYTQDLWPNVYWGFLSDRIIHKIHLRVLNHIKAAVEDQ